MPLSVFIEELIVFIICLKNKQKSDPSLTDVEEDKRS